MASKKISQLPSAAPLTGGEILAGLQSSGDVGVTPAQIATYAGGAVNAATMFGFVGDGVITPGTTFGTGTIVSGTDNANAWNSFNAWAQSRINGAEVWFPPGTYNYDYSLCPIGLFNIPKLHIYGWDCVFQNTYNSTTQGANFFFAEPWPTAAGPYFFPGTTPVNWFINNTTVGANTFTLTTTSDAAHLVVGKWYTLASNDTQYFGDPFNPQYFDLVRVNAINLSTGVVTVDQKIRYPHRTDYPDFNLSGANFACGKARVWDLSPNPGATWDIDHVYEGFTVNLPPGGGHFYWTMTGRRITTIGLKGCPPSESALMWGIHKRPQFQLTGEPDKIVHNLLYDDAEYEGALVFQSSSIDFVTIRNSRINGQLNTGAKYTYVENTDVAGSVVGFGPTFGLANSTILKNCALSAYGSNLEISVLNGAGTVTIDGVNAAFANGIFTLNKAGLGFLLTSWAVVDGQYVNLAGPSNIFTGDTGTGIVTAVTEDATNIYIQTIGLPYATLPVWASGLLYIFRQNLVTLESCFGSDNARIASDSCASGYAYYEKKQYVLGGTFQASGQLSGWEGSIVSMDIDVRHPSPGGSDVVNITVPTFNSASNFTGDSGGTIVSINTGIAGRRFISRAAFVGRKGTDAITVGGSAAQFLPSDRVVQDTAQYAASSPGATVYLTPLIYMTVVFDCGIARKLLTSNFTKAGTTFMLATTGLIP